MITMIVTARRLRFFFHLFEVEIFSVVLTALNVLEHVGIVLEVKQDGCSGKVEDVGRAETNVLQVGLKFGESLKGQA